MHHSLDRSPATTAALLSSLLLSLLLLSLPLLGAVGCDSGPTPADGGAPGMDSGRPGDGGGADGGSGDGAVPPGDGAIDPDGGTMAGGDFVEVRVERPLLETEGEEITRTQVDCVARFETGLPMADPGDWEITVEGAGVIEDAGGYGFMERGVYPVTCRSAALGRSGRSVIVAVYELTDRNVVRLAGLNARAERALGDALAGVVAGDVAPIHAAGAELDAIRGELAAIDFGFSSRLLVEHPEGMPTADEARAAGETGRPDDAAYGPALTEVRDALGALTALYGSLPLDPIADADQAAHEEAAARFYAAEAALSALDESPIAFLEHQAELDQLVTAELVTAQLATLTYLSALFSSAELPADGSGRVVGLIGAALGIAVQHILLQVPTYNRVLTRVGKSAIGMGIMAAARGIIREVFPPTLGAPVISQVFGNSGGFISPGMSWRADMANSDLEVIENNQMIIIPTTAPDFLTSVDRIARNFNAALTGFRDHWLKRIKALYDGLSNLHSAANAAMALGDGIFLTAIGVTEDGLDMIIFPGQTGINCDGLVRNTYVIPIRAGVGFGEAFSVLIPAECSILGCPSSCAVGW